MLAQTGRFTLWRIFIICLFVCLLFNIYIFNLIPPTLRLTGLSEANCHKDFRVDICICIYRKWRHSLNWWTLHDWQADDPEINYKGHYDEEFRQQFPTAPLIVSWVSGVISWTWSTHFISAQSLLPRVEHYKKTKCFQLWYAQPHNRCAFGMHQRCSRFLVAFTWGSQCQHVTSN